MSGVLWHWFMYVNKIWKTIGSAGRYLRQGMGNSIEARVIYQLLVISMSVTHQLLVFIWKRYIKSINGDLRIVSRKNSCSLYYLLVFDSIGFAIAERLGSEGAKVVVSSRKQKNVDSAVEKLKKQGQDVYGLVCHVGNREDRKRLFEKVSFGIFTICCFKI